MQHKVCVGSQRFHLKLKATFALPEIDAQLIGHINHSGIGRRWFPSPGDGTPLGLALGQPQAQMSTVQFASIPSPAGARPEQGFG